MLNRAGLRPPAGGFRAASGLAGRGLLGLGMSATEAPGSGGTAGLGTALAVPRRAVTTETGAEACGRWWAGGGGTIRARVRPKPDPFWPGPEMSATEVLGSGGGTGVGTRFSGSYAGADD